ncbi:MAG: LLM class F420-dependent oxidoreductase [Gammaproteobacteria bacterium]|nr:LLM class F420-dependent oxidoreductase [Gammaproteobacteria bacterium]
MKFGLFGIGAGLSSDPDIATRLAIEAESCGFDSVWTGEHVVLPDPRQPPSPAEPDHPMVHPSTVLAYVAASTKTLKLGTGITLIAQRNPVVLAKEMGSLDHLSKGRLIFGIGAGYLHQEFSALGVNFQQRGERTNEYIEVMRALWTQPKPSYQGKFYQFDQIQAMPRPVQEGGPPIVVGGASDGALRRAVKYGQGWYGFAMNPTQTKTVLDKLRVMGGDGLEISVTPPGRYGIDDIIAFRDIGVHRIIGLLPQRDEDSLFRAVHTMAEFI